MSITKINLENFRNFDKKTIEFSDKTTVIVGPNAIGKTNILEALSLLSTGKSFRAKVEGEMVGYSSEIARIKGIADSSWHLGEQKSPSTNYNLPSTNFDVVLTRGAITVSEGKIEKVQKKKLLVNGVGKRLIDFAGNFKTVLFGPWDMDIISGPPSLRRGFLDNALSQVDREYLRCLLSYEKGLRQRNRILWDLRENPFITTGRERLHFWDKLLIKNGDYIYHKREDFINFCNDFSNEKLMSNGFTLEYDPSIISETRLRDYEREELAAATTLVGPHRDDFHFQEISDKRKEKRDLSTFGSRGEQRMGVLWLKLNELKFIEATQLRSSSFDGQGPRPTLLLDDIFSELDHTHRDVVMSIVGNQQTIITTADEHFIEGLPESSIIKLI
jgi:DNA replication and repair protein RecF